MEEEGERGRERMVEVKRERERERELLLLTKVRGSAAGTFFHLLILFTIII